MASAAYAGIRIVEIASGIAAPYATMFLADHGADVVKVEGPEGDWYRSDPGFETINRNKRAVVVDDPTDLAAMADLLKSADVIVVDRPGLTDRLAAMAPDAVVVSMTPWGEASSLSGHAASPALIAAATGVAWNQISYGEVPVDLVVPITSYGTGVLGALAIAAGLHGRERDGRGRVYEVSEVAGSAAIQIGDTRLGTDVPERPGSSELGSKGRLPCYCLFEAADHKWLFVACGTATFYERLLDLIDRRDLLEHPALPSPPWGLLNDEAIAVLSPILQEALAQQPRSWWLDRLRSADIPAQPVLTREEYLDTSIVRANDLHVDVAHPELAGLKMMGLPVVMSETPGLIRHSAPRLGEHRIEDVLADAPAPRSAGSVPPSEQAPKLPLSGVRVVDLSSFIAGPVISRHLAMLGADVVKVESPTGDPFRAIGPAFSNWNHGKRSICLDLRDPQEQGVLHELARRSDCVIENFRPGVAGRLGADAATLRSLNGELILLAAPGYGADESMADAAAFDPLLQALGGIMAAQGGDSEPVFLTVPIHDVVTPMLGAFAVVTGLFHRERTGVAQDVMTSLAHTVMAVQAAEYTMFEGAPDRPVGGFDHPGDGERTGWREGDDGELIFFDRDDEVAIARHGFVNTRLAEENGLLVTHDDPTHGPMTQIGQLVAGAGPAPSRAPAMGEHSDEIRAELAAES